MINYKKCITAGVPKLFCPLNHLICKIFTCDIVNILKIQRHNIIACNCNRVVYSDTERIFFSLKMLVNVRIGLKLTNFAPTGYNSILNTDSLID